MKPGRPACLSLILLWVVVTPLTAASQTPTKAARIGWMSVGNPTVSDPTMNAFLQGMRELGYVEGQTFLLEPRYAAGKIDLMPEQAAELERSGVDVIIAGPFAALQAAKKSTSRVPIIMTPSADPTATGIVNSLARPGGNITGITEMMPELVPQRLRLLKQIVPTMTRVAVLWQPGTLTDEVFKAALQETQSAARSLGMQIQVVEAASAGDFDAAFSVMVKEQAEGLIVLVNPMFVGQRQQIIDRAAKQKLPAIYEWTFFVQSGGLVSHGADVLDVYRRAAGLVDKILKGAKPGDLPVERPTRVNTGVNLKAAKALGVVIPESIVKEAVMVIE